MISNAQRGAYVKRRARKYLEAQGYQVASLEVVHWIFRGHGGRMPVKRDQFGSDLLGVSSTGIVFVQVKGGAAARIGNFPDARRKFEAFTFPPNVRCLVIAFPPRARLPRVLDLTPYQTGLI